MLKHSLGATKDRPTGEDNDCAVIALANAAGIPYAEAHQRLAAQGRRPRHGTKTSASSRALHQLVSDGKLAKVTEQVIGVPMSMLSRGYRLGYPTVAQFLRSLPKQGSYFLSCTTHAFAYVDGVLYDNIDGGKMRARMKRCFKLDKLNNSQQLTQADISELWERLNKIKL
jgi:hypothetical protein